ncbi:hypothetical protein PTTG_02619 [Puccinia triticina 1-1 BBBD Race 1]|uniref:Uncharacterized protein n=2 Tax=Puccinia triticina TaxID=208348 RepID=A0A180GH63_PUCT1|nr:uncharacterized protein PtA15_1A87 [Puccinia triticina]OAV91914.1 hypothetical protein PTTG_02619 [Puccinia triticina 1-1 BBBD Race 1]WAQ80749.1 hypothetical protein PtA15_1A87 [Puccinia triticina]WAR51639.1 hypothetical protein PtB15_1B75 [Puccinia triticina]
MRYVALVTFLAHFPLYDSLPMLKGINTARTTIESTHDGQAATDIATASRANAQITSSAGPLDIMKPLKENSGVSLAEKDLRVDLPSSSDHSSSSRSSTDSVETFSPARTSSFDDSPRSSGTISSASSTEASGKIQENSLVEKSGQTSPAPVATSESASQLKSIYRELASSVEIDKTPVQLPEKTYWDRVTTFWDQAKEYLPFGPRGTVTQFNRADEIELNAWLLRVKHRLNRQEAQILDEYYQAFSASSKKSTTMMKLDPDTDKSLSEWKKANPVPHSIFRQFFGKILTEREYLRRDNVFGIQREQFRIVANWQKAEQEIGKSFPIEAVKKFGNALGGKEFFPAFGAEKAKETLDQISVLKAEHHGLSKAWRGHLKEDEYIARIELLKALANMKNPGKIPSETISAWRAQGLDVPRMLKVFDYSLERNGIVGEGKTLDFRLDNRKNFKSAKDQFFPNNAQDIPWLESLEHQELLQISEDTQLKYLGLREELEKTPTPPKTPRPTGDRILQNQDVKENVKSFLDPFRIRAWLRPSKLIRTKEEPADKLSNSASDSSSP